MTQQYKITYEQLESVKSLQFSLNDAKIAQKVTTLKYQEACAALASINVKFEAYKHSTMGL